MGVIRGRLRTMTVLLLAGALGVSTRAGAQEPLPPGPEPGKAKAPADQAAKPEAQAKRQPRPGDVQKVFVVEHVSARALGQLLAVFPASISYSTYANTQALAVSASPAVLAAIAETLKRLDVPASPAKNVELTGYVIEALAQPVDGARVPPELEGVVAQLKRSFNYAAYRVVDTLIARAREGSELSASAVAEASHDEKGLRSSYTLRARRAVASPGDRGQIVRLDGLTFEARIPIAMHAGSASPIDYPTVGVRADLDIREGQRVVVGKSGVGEAGNAIILVLSAKVVD